MEPMDLDVEESSCSVKGKFEYESSVSSNNSDMEVDASPLKHSLDSHYDGEEHLSSGTIRTKVSNIGSFQKDSPSSSLATMNPSKKITKTGYGIPEDDTTFSHFPEKGYKHSSTNPVQRRIPKILRKDEGVKSQSLRYNSGGKANCMKSCCHVMLNIVKTVMFFGIVCLVLLYFVNMHREKCRLSRQFNSNALKTDLETLVFGQPFASEIIAHEMEVYFQKLQSTEQASTKNEKEISNVKICKPLVLSFHGWTGVGKNFISKIITESFPYSLVNNIIIPMHFPHEAFEHRYGQIIQDWVVTNNTACTVNVIIMDEMDKAFSPVTEGIIGAIEALSQPCHLATPTIILLLSNSYATDINRLFLELVTQEENRDKMPLKQFQPIFSQKVNGSWNALLDKKSLIDAYVPFLPLERKHVVQCIKRDLVAKRFSTGSEAVEKILGELTFTSIAGLEISTTGCKRVGDKVDYVMLGF